MSAWERFWYRPESARNLAAARILLAGTALWVVLSRSDLPVVLEYPAELWSAVTTARHLRFLLVFGIGTERVLYALLHVALVAALIGVLPRVACFVSGLLLYHFGPLETLIWTPNPYLRGFTLPTLGLLILSFSPGGAAFAVWPRHRPDATRAAGERWPLALIQILFCQIYVFSAWAKLVTAGPAWLTAENIRGWLLALNQVLDPFPPASFGYAVAAVPVLCGSIAWAGLAFELGAPAGLFTRAGRRVFLPVAGLFHLANSLLFGVFFHNVTLLLLFVDWEAVQSRLGRTG